MPELPEVETIAAALRQGGRDAPPILGRQVLEVTLLWERTLAFPSAEEFCARLKGQRILEIGRRGKFLILRLSQDFLLIHLRMSGDLRVEPTGTALAPHDRLVLDLEGGLRLAFNDTRKFGRAWLVADPEDVLEGLGPEPFDPDFTSQVLYQRLQERRRQLKPLLLDQAFIAGLGNIYADEALHFARLHPLVNSAELSAEQVERLWEGVRYVLSEGILRSGASIDWVYRGGEFQNYFRVYDREGQPCPNCGTPIVKITVGQRGTHFCPNCQRLE